MKTPFLLAVLLLTGCTATPPSPTASPQNPTPAASLPAGASSTPAASPNAPATPHPTLISATGIGDAQLGMTLGELKQKLGTAAEFVVQSPFMVDFDAIAVRQSGQVQYYILHLAGKPLGDRDTVQGLLTRNPAYKTAEGVGAGTSLTQAEAAYGKATLSYNTQNESREYARFERQPAPNISFATGNASQQAAGIYPNATSEYRETREFKPNAAIESVLVVCLTSGCAAP